MAKNKLSGAREAPLYPKSSGVSATNENQIPTPFNWYLSTDKKTVHVVLKDGYELSVDINGDADTVDGEHASAFVDLVSNQTIGGTKTFNTMPIYDSDPIVESGSNSDGEWTRWADGTQVCFGVINLTLINVDTAYGSLYRSSLLDGPTWPKSFISEPAHSYMVVKSSVTMWLSCTHSVSTLTKGSSFYIAKGTSHTNLDIDVSWHSIGRYK